MDASLALLNAYNDFAPSGVAVRNALDNRHLDGIDALTAALRETDSPRSRHTSGFASSGRKR
ncbi:hypothetical protein ABZX62_13615 [Streptomyces flavidovirens]|uniref:hypothetical protein n=1 Tax=Streptomyces flavidovirens TaxID=67298 RepID=UPI0033A20F3E